VRQCDNCHTKTPNKFENKPSRRNPFLHDVEMHLGEGAPNNLFIFLNFIFLSFSPLSTSLGAESFFFPHGTIKQDKVSSWDLLPSGYK
jgi:hypothetical protein